MADISINTKITHYKYTILLLCLGYFIDFYDLTIFGAGYVDLIKQQFEIIAPGQIQQLYLYITNWHTLGILIGCIFFGILGDKLGRTAVIRYSILLYSVSILSSLFIKSVPLFCFFRFLTGAGLACEFATSNVLISEMINNNFKSYQSAALLYGCGILGGLTALIFSSISWQIMFMFGGISGILLYFGRKRMYESVLFQSIIKQKNIHKGKIIYLINNFKTIIKMFKLFLLITPFYLITSIMFVFPSFMNLHQGLASAIRVILLGFFLGGLVGLFISGFIINRLQNYIKYLMISFILILLILLIPFKYITDQTLCIYCVCIGIVGGSYAPIWIQLVNKAFGTNIRNTASNSLFALGRVSSIFFNLVISYSIMNLDMGLTYLHYLIIVTLLLSIFSLFKIKNNYHSRLDYLENI